MAVFLGALPTLLLYRHLYGSIFMLPQGRYYVQFGHGHPFLLLFSPNGGLLFATPAMWLPILGIVPGLRRQPWLVAGLLLAACAEIYVASCPLAWDGSSTFGARVLTPLTPLFVLLSAFLVARAHQWLGARPGRTIVGLVVALAVPFYFASTSAVAGLWNSRVPMGGASQEATYGAAVRWGWAILDKNIGDLSVLPAEVLFSWRYGLPRQSFRRATAATTFERNYKSLALSNDVIRFSTPDVAPLLRGFSVSKAGAAISGTRASIVFTAKWPHATGISVAATASTPRRLRVGVGRFWGTTWLGEVTVSERAPNPWPALSLPAGSFDSGLNEFVFACDPSPCAGGVVLEAIRLHDDNQYLPALK